MSMKNSNDIIGNWTRVLPYVCMFVCMYVCMYVCVCVYVCVCMYVCIYVCVCMYVCVCVYVCMCVCMYVYMYVCVCMYVCMYVRTYLFRHISKYACYTVVLVPGNPLYSYLETWRICVFVPVCVCAWQHESPATLYAVIVHISVSCVHYISSAFPRVWIVCSVVSCHMGSLRETPPLKLVVSCHLVAVH